MKRTALALVALAASACGDGKDRRDPPPESAPATQPATPSPPAPAPAPATPPAALEPLGPPLATQPPRSMVTASFEGWTEDGRRFAVRAQHGVDVEALGGADLIELVQLHDALTGQMIDSFGIDRVVDDPRDARPRLAKAWKQARPRDEWQRFRADNRLVGATAHLGQPDGAWALRAETDEQAPHGSTFEIGAADDELTTRWTGFREDLAQTAAGHSARSPLVRVIATHGEQSYQLLSFHVPWDYDAVNAARGARTPTVEGRVAAFWSPSGDRVLLMVTHEAIDTHGEHGELIQTRFYVRALGPQIEIVDAGAGELAAHRLAALLGANRLPVSRITSEDRAAGVYYRGDEHAELARRVAALAGEARIEPASDRGWASVIIALAK